MYHTMATGPGSTKGMADFPNKSLGSWLLANDPFPMEIRPWRILIGGGRGLNTGETDQRTHKIYWRII